MISRYLDNIFAKDISSGSLTAVNSYNGSLLNINYEDAIGLGVVPNRSHFSGKGRRDALATTAGGDDISDLVSVTIPFPNQAGEQMTLVSDSANDTSAGSGARTVKVHYLDATGAYTHEIVSMNGVTPVNTAATNIRFVQQITVQTNGSFGARNAGNITIYSTATPANIFARISPLNNVSMSSARMVPLGHTFWLKTLNVSSTSSKPLSVRLTATCDHAGVYSEGVFQFNEVVEMQDDVVSINFDVPRKIPALAIIKGIAVSTLSGGVVSLSYDGFLD